MTPVKSSRTLTDLGPGAHLCCLYETEEELRAVLSPFLRQGLEQGEKVLYIVDAHTAETILGYLRDDGLNVEPYLTRGQLAILTRDDAYVRDGVFDPDGMIALLRSETERALAEGYPALRVTGEMSWALSRIPARGRGLPGSERLIEYEARLNEFFPGPEARTGPGSRCLAICQYDRRRFDPAVLLDVLRVHPVAVIGTEVYDNFYYVPPSKLLGQDPAEAELRHWVHNLAERVRVEEALRRRAEAMAALVEMNRAITEDIGLKETLDRILSTARKMLTVSECSVTLVDESSGDLVVEASTDGEIGLRISPAAPSAVGWVVKTKQILAEEEVSTNPIFNQELVQRYEIKSALVVPIIYKDKAIGALSFADYHGRRVFSNDERMMAQAFAHQAAIAIENARLFEQVCAGRERLQALSHRLVEVQEVERRQIARELHDEIGQLLTGLKLTLDMRTRLPADAVGASLEEAQALVNDLIARVRDLSLDLRPAMLDDLGLLPTLLWYFERYTARTNVRVTFKHNGLEGRRFRPEVETAAYRIVQEALTNVARHAGVSEVTVRVWGNRDILGLQIEDQGIGFDVEATLAARRAGGLLGMRERALLVGGNLAIESDPGIGTCLTAELPLSGHLERRERGR